MFDEDLPGLGAVDALFSVAERWVGMALDAEAGAQGISPTEANLEQIRGALGWLVGGLVLLVPLGALLFWLVRAPDSSDRSVID